MTTSECVDDTREKIIALESMVKTWFLLHDKRSDDHWDGIKVALAKIDASIKDYVPREEMKACFKSVDTRFSWIWKALGGVAGLAAAGFWFLLNFQSHIK